ncbi:MAG: 5-bromo-4-chloroindolyl phosphate hydrolysis family protein [Christensenellales bacterium]|jgi:hypothetical protein
MKQVRIKSAIPLYGAAAVWLILGAATPMYRLSMILLALALSVGAYFALGKIFPGRMAEVRAAADSGDKQVDLQIEAGRETLARIRQSNDAIPDPAMSARIARMEDAGAKIFDLLEKDTKKSSQVRRFMTYYLPTADKLLDRYRALSAGGGSGVNVQKSLTIIEDSMEMIAVAFEKQLDALYRDAALDIETDITVLETVIKSEGHAERSSPGGLK